MVDWTKLYYDFCCVLIFDYMFAVVQINSVIRSFLIIWCRCFKNHSQIEFFWESHWLILCGGWFEMYERVMVIVGSLYGQSDIQKVHNFKICFDFDFEPSIFKYFDNRFFGLIYFFNCLLFVIVSTQYLDTIRNQFCQWCVLIGIVCKFRLTHRFQLYHCCAWLYRNN